MGSPSPWSSRVGFATDWAGPSAVRSDPNPGYDRVREAVAAGRRARVSTPGDPAASARALLRIVDADEPPLRVVFGTAPLGIAKSDDAPTRHLGGVERRLRDRPWDLAQGNQPQGNQPSGTSPSGTSPRGTSPGEPAHSAGGSVRALIHARDQRDRGSPAQ